MSDKDKPKPKPESMADRLRKSNPDVVSKRPPATDDRNGSLRRGWKSGGKR